ncbi:MAG: YciI family protein, partial [Wenzhouxiangellaceae bacterium]
YLCLVYAQEDRLHDSPESPRDPECHAYATSLAERGRLVAGQALEPVSTATTVRVRGGETMVTDGPFAETAEQLTGFYLIEARDLNEAIRIAEGIPPARVGSIEVRPVRELQLEAEGAA